MAASLRLLALAACTSVATSAFCSGSVSWCSLERAHCNAARALHPIRQNAGIHDAVVDLQLLPQPNPNAQPNTYAINTTAPTFVRSVPNGKLYRAGTPGFEFNVAHIWGTAYELGYAHGELFKETAGNISLAVWGYMEQQVIENLTFLPVWLADIIADYGLEVALDLLADMTAPSTGQHFFDELHGLADATGVDYKMLLHIHLIGELTQGDCSMYGAWGNATLGGKTLAMRALDWDTDIPCVQDPTVFIYHPSDGSNEFANVGFVGWIGALTGQSSKQMSIHEIGVAFPDSTFGNESYAGVPFVFLLRDILQFDATYNDTIARIKGANRTCDLILGTGDGAYRHRHAHTHKRLHVVRVCLHTYLRVVRCAQLTLSCLLVAQAWVVSSPQSY